MKRNILVLTMLLVAPSLALAQTPEERIQAATGRALAAGIPVSLIEAKVAEGRAKGVPMERLAAAIERREAALERAQEAIGHRDGVGAGELSVAADALGAGVSAAVLARLAEVSGAERRTVAIAALGQLVASGVLPEEALEQVTAALARGDEALANLPAQAAGAAARRGPPAGAGKPGEPGAPTIIPVGPPSGVPAPGQKPSTTPTVPVPPRSGGN